MPGNPAWKGQRKMKGFQVRFTTPGEVKTLVTSRVYDIHTFIVPVQNRFNPKEATMNIQCMFLVTIGDKFTYIPASECEYVSDVIDKPKYDG